VPRTPDVVDKIEISIHTSIGITIAPKYANTRESLLLSADSALRKAKDLGRNRVEMVG
jgi:GGDEF domain-containing protein